jgi:hypothetical protein
MDVMEHHMDILHRNKEIIHNQIYEPLIEFPDEPVYPHVPDPYALLTPAELEAFGIGPSRAPTTNNDDDGDNGDEEEANDDEETEDDE